MLYFLCSCSYFFHIAHILTVLLTSSLKINSLLFWTHPVHVIAIPARQCYQYNTCMNKAQMRVIAASPYCELKSVGPSKQHAVGGLRLTGKVGLPSTVPINVSLGWSGLGGTVVKL